MSIIRNVAALILLAFLAAVTLADSPPARQETVQ